LRFERGVAARSRRYFSSTPIVSIVAMDAAGAAAFLVSRCTDDTSVMRSLCHAECVCDRVDRCDLLDRASRALGMEGRRRKRQRRCRNSDWLLGWQLPLSRRAFRIVEKEVRYAMRNAQVRMMALMPLILIVIRVVNSQRWGAADASDGFLVYGSGLLATGGVLYVFLILAGLSCNHFAFEEGGMRTLILSPIDRRKVLLGKNIAITLLALIFATILLTLNAIVFRDLDAAKLLFIALSFVSFAALSAMMGNWFRFVFRSVCGLESD
jgi:hypothetical protein